jgi:hypothetical protein
LFPLLSYKKFASPGEKEKEAKLLTVPKEFRAIATRATQQEMFAPTTYIKVEIQIISGQETEKPTIY